MTASQTLEDLLRERTREGDLFDKLPDSEVRCRACAHECRIKDGKSGICRVRYNEGGVLRVPYGYAAGLQIDPIEKKPFFHVLPGSDALSFGMLGCNFKCSFCQNWVSSQAVKDPHAGHPPTPCTAEDLARTAVREQAPLVTATYNEPLITSEWAAAVFREAKEAGLRCGFVSNGYATPRVLRYLRPVLDFYKVDLKGFDEARYKKVTGGKLSHVLRAIEDLAGLGFWVEVVTLVVPGFNDADGQLRGIAGFLASVSKDIPWHVTAFHGDYKMADAPRTPVQTLRRAVDIGRAEGIRHVYSGNLPGAIEHGEDTLCHGCGAVLVERMGFRVRSNRVDKGRCPECKAKIAGVWE